MSTVGTPTANTVTGTGAAVGGAVPDKYDDYSLRSVPESEIKSTWDIALVRMGFTVPATDLVYGYTLGLFFSFGNVLLRRRLLRDHRRGQHPHGAHRRP
jgi:hypothetical protein